MFIEASTWLAFSVTSLIIELTPGPNMAYLAILTTAEGKRAGFSAVAGVAAGLLLIGLAASAGLATLISQSDVLYQGLRWGGVLYLLWLAWESWQEERETSPSRTDAFQSRYFYRGLITNLLNPKAMLFYVAILPEFLDIKENLIEQAVILTVIYVGIATVIHILVVMAAYTSRRFFAGRNPFYVRRASSLLLVLVAMWLALK